MSEIHKNVLSSSFQIMLGTETSWNESVKSEEIFGSNYNVYRDDRDLLLSHRMSGGGVLVAVSFKFNSELLLLSKFKEFDHVWVKTEIDGETHIFASVYFPPDQACKPTYETFFQAAEDIMSSFPPEYKVHIYGDFNQRNADFLPDSDNDSILLPVVGDNETLQLIFENIASLGLNQVNHVKNQQNCYLDFLLTNTYEDFCVYESISLLWKNEAFHTEIEYSIFIHKTHNSSDCDYEYICDFKEANYAEIRNALCGTNCQSILNNQVNIECVVDAFYKILMNIIQGKVPLVKKRRNYNTKNPVWFNLKNRKQKAQKIYKNLNNQQNLENYLNICEQLNSAISTAHNEYNTKTENKIKSCHTTSHVIPQ